MHNTHLHTQFQITNDCEVHQPGGNGCLWDVEDLSSVVFSFPLPPCNSDPREVAQLNGSIGSVAGEYSSSERLELVGQCLLVAFGREEGQRRELARALQVGTVLQLQGDWLRESLRKGCPVDPTDQLCVI